MLSKSHRINTKPEFDLVFKRGRKYSGKYFLIYVLTNPPAPIVSQSLPKFGIIASKKVGTAVKRNHAKRLMREVVMADMKRFKRDFAAIIVTFGSLSEADLSTVQPEAEKIFEQAQLFQE
jgi:ribonuclease P protein component